MIKACCFVQVANDIVLHHDCMRAVLGQCNGYEVGHNPPPPLPVDVPLNTTCSVENEPLVGLIGIETKSHAFVNIPARCSADGSGGHGGRLVQVRLPHP